MPNALTFIIGADAGPFETETRRTEQISMASSGRIKANLEKMAGEIETRMAKAASMGMPIAHLEANLDAVRGTLNAVTASQVAYTAATVKNTVATKANLATGIEWRMIMREMLVIMREFARGNWTRIPGSVSIIIQSLNLSLSQMIGFLTKIAGLTIVAVVAENIAGGIKRMAEGAEMAADRIGNLTNRLEAHISSMRRAAEQAQDYQSWLSKLNESDTTIASTTAEKLRQMREEFELRQRLAELQGQSPQEKFQSEMNQASGELSVLQSARDAAAQNAEDAKTKAAQVEASFPEGTMEDREVAERAAERNARILAAVMGQFGEQSSGSALRAAWKSNTIPQLFSAFKAPEDRLLNFDFDGKKVSLTLAQAKANFQAAEKDAESLGATVRNAEDQRRDARERAQQAKKEAASLDKEVAEKEQHLALLQQYGPRIADATQDFQDALSGGADGKPTKIRGRVNSEQSIGFHYLLSANDQHLQVARQSERHLASIDRKIKSGGSSHHKAFGEGEY